MTDFPAHIIARRPGKDPLWWETKVYKSAEARDRGVRDLVAQVTRSFGLAGAANIEAGGVTVIALHSPPVGARPTDEHLCERFGVKVDERGLTL